MFELYTEQLCTGREPSFFVAFDLVPALALGTPPLLRSLYMLATVFEPCVMPAEPHGFLKVKACAAHFLQEVVFFLALLERKNELFAVLQCSAVAH